MGRIPDNLNGLIATITLVGIVIGWFIKQWTSYRRSTRFVESMATNHLPHVYAILQLIARKLNIPDLPEHPNINF